MATTHTRFIRSIVVLGAVLGLAVGVTSSSARDGRADGDGQSIFRFDTFGDEQLWTGFLRMHEAVAQVTPATALAVGLKVDVDALPLAIQNALRDKQINLDDPAVTAQLLRLNAVVGLKGSISDTGTITSLGITCAFCHSTVDNSFASGIG